MKNKSRLVLIISLAFMLLSYAAPQSLAATEEELSMQRLQDRINTMEKSMTTMQQELYRSGKSKDKGKHAASPEPIGTEDERDRAMNGKIEELEHNITTLAAKLDKIIADIDFRIAALEKKTTTPTSAPEAVTPAPTAAAPVATKPVDTVPDAKKI